MIITRELIEKSELEGIHDNRTHEVLQRINGKSWSYLEFPFHAYLLSVKDGFKKAKDFTEEIIKDYQLTGENIDFGFSVDRSEKTYVINDMRTEVYGDDLYMELYGETGAPKALYYTMDSIPQAKDIVKRWLDLVVPLIEEAKSEVRYVSLLTQDSNGNFRENTIPLGSMLNIDVKKNYMPDLPDERIKEKLMENRGGIMIFHGEPGTGKSSYIKHLMETMTDATFVIIDPATIQLASEGFKNYLIANTLGKSMNDCIQENAVFSVSGTSLKKAKYIGGECDVTVGEEKSKDNKFTPTIYILEDAEKLLLKRNESTNPVNLSNILNITDGIIGDLVKAKFICTFNCSLSEIDTAILRKGRLLQKYQFEPLSGDTLKNLAKELGIPEEDLPKSATLADLYGWSDKNGLETKKKSSIGF